MNDDNYQRLTYTLSQLGGAIPVFPSPEFTALIKELFTPEEAGLAAIMPIGLNNLETIETHTGRPAADIHPLLENMADKGLIYHQKRNDQDLYKLMPVLPGIFEYQFMKGGYTEKDYKLARIFKEYFDKVWSNKELMTNPILKKITPFSRVIPVEKELSGGGQVVHPYEKVSEYIRNASHISVSTCYCRHHGELLGDPCDKPKENCLSFGPNAVYAHERGYGRLISKEDASRLLDEAEAAGLVHMSSNTSKYIDFICNCCLCHCGIIQSFDNMDMPSIGAVSAFRLKIDEEQCIGCEDCVEICPLKALEVKDALIQVNRKRCIGCGLCNRACPNEALSMERVADAPIPPLDNKALTASIIESIQQATK